MIIFIHEDTFIKKTSSHSYSNVRTGQIGENVFLYMVMCHYRC